MSAMAHRPTPEPAMDSIARHSHLGQGPAAESESSSSATPARLQVIHELIRSGDYHVPATAIADRMIEHMMGDERERNS
jgi:anti-sigma28 factor (negative regulator of flagellin synthesis)